MMTQKERFLALLHNEPVDGIVKAYAPMGDFAGFAFGSPLSRIEPREKGKQTVSGWGVTYAWPEDEPGAVPMTDPEHVLIKDIEEWDKYLKRPDLSTKDSEWDDLRARLKDARSKGLLTSAFFAPGTFEYLHSFMSFDDSLANLYIYDEEMHDIMKYIGDFQIDWWTEMFNHLDGLLDASFDHDDWGSKFSTFFSVDMFEDYFAPIYKQLYEIAHDKGLITIHHSDSYCTTFIDTFIDMGMDVWQGVLPSNDYELLQKKLNDENRQFLLWGGLDSTVFDRDDSTEEEIRKHVQDTVAKYLPGGHWIPSVNDGLPLIIHQQNYAIISDELDKIDARYQDFLK